MNGYKYIVYKRENKKFGEILEKVFFKIWWDF